MVFPARLRRPFRLLPALVLALSLAACGDDSAGPPPDADGDGVADTDDAFPNDPSESADTDRDGLGDNADPTPAGTAENRLNGTFTGGAAKAVAITWYAADGMEDVGEVYHTELDEGCGTNWYPQGTLCDAAPGQHSPDLSTRSDQDTGATWDNDFAGGTGVLVVDACSDGSCAAVDFNRARIFQMYSDGKTTHLRISTHPERGDTPPAWNDAGWRTITGFETIGAGTDQDGDGLVVLDPTVLGVVPSVTRYVKIEARNDGTLEDEGYIEVRCVKLFSVPLS
jgi:hypothetical protein